MPFDDICPEGLPERSLIFVPMMPASATCTLTRDERLKSELLIDRLFNGGGSRSMSAYPLRLVYMTIDTEEHDEVNSILVSVPKRFLKHAVDRNRVKRQVREAYRKNKHLLQAREGKRVLMAFIWQDARLHDSAAVEHKVQNLLTRLNERL